LALSLRNNQNEKTENANKRVHEWLKTSFCGANESDCRRGKENKPPKKAKLSPWTVIGMIASLY